MAQGATRRVQLITYDGQIVATAGARRFYLAHPIDALPDDDPMAVFVTLMATYALQVRAHPDVGPYTDERAERFARIVLIDDEEFRSFDANELDDTVIAGHFGIPVEQVDRKRADLSGAHT